MADEVQFRIDGPMMTRGTAAWGAGEAGRVKASQQRLSDAVGTSADVGRLHEWLSQGTKLSICVEFHLRPDRVTRSDLDNLLGAVFNTLVEAAGFGRPAGKPIPQTKDALFWRVEAEKVRDEEEHTIIRVAPL